MAQSNCYAQCGGCGFLESRSVFNTNNRGAEGDFDACPFCGSEDVDVYSREGVEIEMPDMTDLLFTNKVYGAESGRTRCDKPNVLAMRRFRAVS